MSRAAVIFPGRGAYGPGSLGSLTAGHPWVRRADELRAASDLRPISEVDAAERFDPAIHLRPTNAWPLIFLCGLLDAERIADDHEVVAVTASSTGWYTALAAAGVIGFDDAYRLVEAMARAAETPLADGERPAEVIYPLTDEEWQPSEERIDRLDVALDVAEPNAYVAVDLGGFVVVGGTVTAIETLASALPPVTIGERTFPLRLATADAWHTSLRAEAIDAAVAELGSIAWERPNVTLIDGRGVRFTPWSTDPTELAAHSLTGQGSTTYDFAAGMRVALREYAPDVVLLAGPGGSLGGACAQIVVMERYRGIGSRTEFEAAQAGPGAILLSLRR
jgi:acyl transferase domain-containing protein